MKRSRSRRIRRRASIAAVVPALAAILGACTTSESTGIVFVPSSLIVSGLRSVVLRVYGTRGDLSFCGEYLVDESAPPGDTIALVARESSIVLAPSSDGSDQVRIVVDGFAAPSSGACDGVSSSRTNASAKPLIRKVTVARYAQSRVLRLGTLFDFGCLKKVDCNEVDSTCVRGACVPLGTEEAVGVVAGAGCFDVRACPNLERASLLAPENDPCSFGLRPESQNARGYVALSYSVEDVDENGAGLRGVAVLGPSDFTRSPGNVIELRDGACTLARAGHVTAVYFGSDCEGPLPGQPICVADDTASSPIARIDPNVAVLARDAAAADATFGTDADAERDGATNDARAGDSGEGAASDAAGADSAAGDGGPDAGGREDSGTAPGANVRCTSNTVCALNSTFCCAQGTPQCVANGTICPSDIRCDDASDCNAGDVCCDVSVGSSLRSACTPTAACAVDKVLCSESDSLCPATAPICAHGRSSLPLDSFCMSLAFSSVGCGSAACAMGEVCCAQTLACGPQQGGTCGFDVAPFYRRYLCDDTSDCPVGRFCCHGSGGGDDPGARFSFCTDPQSCLNNDFLCSPGDPRCPLGMNCTIQSGPLPASNECQ